MAPGSSAKKQGDAARAAAGGRRAKRKAEDDITPGQASAEPDTELVFEDPYGDEYETDEDAPPPSAPAPGAPPPPPGTQPMVHAGKVVFRPGIDKLADGETLVCDESAYDLLHRLTPEWPALSFDFVCCDAAGAYTNVDCVPLATYPVSVMAVAGTQAQASKQNKLQVVKLSNMHRTRRQRRARDDDDDSASDESDDGSDDGDDDDDDDDDALDDGMTDGILQNIDIKFDCVVNRVRAMPQRANIVAVWGESGRVSLLDVAPALDALNRDGAKRMQLPAAGGAAAAAAARPGAIKPFMSYAGHKEEGYALAWSRVVPGRLVSGANNGGIYAWALAGDADGGGGEWAVCPDRFRGHKGSVEDLQWSPNERNVFASCSSDRSICFWDTRQYRKPAARIGGAHAGDVNVISWNASEAHLVVSGGDDGVIKVWDLRALDAGADAGGGAASRAPAPAAEFSQHKQPVTSVEWHPRDASMLAASSEDGSVSVWDLAVERDAEEEMAEGVVVAGADEYPPQLLFIHMGQTNTKEVHWHPACNSLLGSTAEDGMNFFKPANISLPAGRVGGGG
jgi:ribosome assembly protein RRB1